MEHNFDKTRILCLDTALQEIRTGEQTQEIKLPDGMPDVEQITAAWGQVILRGKEWRADSIAVTGGMMVWVLYKPEDGSAEVCMDAWIPFQLRWDLPEGTGEGSIRVKCLPRFVDARPVSARKIMVRTGVSALMSAMVPDSLEVFAPKEAIPEAELLRSCYPVRLPMEAGEKSFLQEESLSVPDSQPQPETLICYHIEPKIMDKKVLGNRMVFRGESILHVLYQCPEGRLHSWDFSVPFSQYADLNLEHGTDAQSDLILCPTSLDLELEEGTLGLKCGVAAQYLITDKQMLTLIEDAYSPGRELEINRALLELTAVLENRQESVFAEQMVPGEATQVVDTAMLMDFPRQESIPQGMELTLPGTVQTVYYGEDGKLHGGTNRWEGKLRLPADESSRITAMPRSPEVHAMPGTSCIQVKGEIPLELTATARQEIPMVTGVALGQQKELDPERPTLILRRAGEKRLWDIAKGCGSTVEAIQNANGLQEEPIPGQMLLIPIS